MQELTASEFSAIVRAGMLDADATYLDWTGGWGIADGGIEGFITSWIAKHLVDGTRKTRGPKGGYAALELTLENLIYDLSYEDRRNHFRELLKAACESNEKIANSLSPKARLDLVFYDGCWPENVDKLRPRGIVEVKRWFDKSSYPKDMRRIGNLLKFFGPSCGGSLLYGCFVFFIFERSRTSVEASLKRIQGLRSDFEEYGGPCRIETTPVLDDGGLSKAASVAVIFEAPV